MKVYECTICQFTTKLKGNYRQHITTKKHIKNFSYFNKKNNQENTMNQINDVEYKMNQNESILIPNESLLNPNESLLNPNESLTNNYESELNHYESCLNLNESYYDSKIFGQKKKGSKIYTCENCGNEYSTCSNLRRHEKKCNSKNPEYIQVIETMKKKHDEELKLQQDKINSMEKEKEMMRDQISLLIDKVGDITNITQNNNIVLNCYGSENLSHITDHFKTELLKIPYAMIPRMIEAIHFNKAHPENKNIYLPNKKEPYVKVYQGESWVYKDKRETIKELVDKNYTILDNHYDKSKNLTEIHVDRYKDFKSKFTPKEDSSQKSVAKKISSDIELMLINNNSNIGS